MPDWVEMAKLAVRPRYSFALWVTSLVILLVKLPVELRIQKIRDDFGPWIGLAALFFFVVWLVELFLVCSDKIVGFYKPLSEKKKLKATIQGLNGSERAILAKHLDKNETTLNWPADKPGIASLVHKEILDRIASTSSFGTPYVVKSNVWQYLLKNKDRFISVDSAGEAPAGTDS